jgi:DNA-binding GntR family transcriptional regulator
MPTLASASSRKALERTTREHRGIYDALAVGDGDRAAELIAAHIDSAWAERKGRTKRS